MRSGCYFVAMATNSDGIRADCQSGEAGLFMSGSDFQVRVKFGSTGPRAKVRVKSGSTGPRAKVRSLRPSTTDLGSRRVSAGNSDPDRAPKYRRPKILERAEAVKYRPRTGVDQGAADRGGRTRASGPAPAAQAGPLEALSPSRVRLRF